MGDVAHGLASRKYYAATGNVTRQAAAWPSSLARDCCGTCCVLLLRRRPCSGQIDGSTRSACVWPAGVTAFTSWPASARHCPCMLARHGATDYNVHVLTVCDTVRRGKCWRSIGRCFGRPGSSLQRSVAPLLRTHGASLSGRHHCHLAGRMLSTAMQPLCLHSTTLSDLSLTTGFLLHRHRDVNPKDYQLIEVRHPHVVHC
jgi:hypothetical protein